MARGGKRLGAGRPRYSDADRLEVGRQAHRIIERYEQQRHFDPDDIGSAAKRHMRKYNAQIKTLKNEETALMRGTDRRETIADLLESNLKYRRQLTKGEHKDDVSYALREDQCISGAAIDVKPSRFLRITGPLPRRYRKREKFLTEAVRELDDSGQFMFRVTRKLVESSLRLYNASLPASQAVAVQAQTFEWSEPTAPNYSAEYDDDASDPGYGLAPKG